MPKKYYKRSRSRSKRRNSRSYSPKRRNYKSRSRSRKTAVKYNCRTHKKADDCYSDPNCHYNPKTEDCVSGNYFDNTSSYKYRDAILKRDDELKEYVKSGSFKSNRDVFEAVSKKYPDGYYSKYPQSHASRPIYRRNKADECEKFDHNAVDCYANSGCHFNPDDDTCRRGNYFDGRGYYDESDLPSDARYKNLVGEMKGYRGKDLTDDAKNKPRNVLNTDTVRHVINNYVEPESRRNYKYLERLRNEEKDKKVKTDIKTYFKFV